MKDSLLSSLLLVCVVLVLFGSGFLVGREFPRHHYERIPDSSYFIDTSTGKACALLAPIPGNIPIPKCGEK